MGSEYLLNIVNLLGEVAQKQSTGRLTLGGESAGSLEFSEGKLVGFLPPGAGRTDPAGPGSPVNPSETPRHAVSQAILLASDAGSPSRFVLPSGETDRPAGDPLGLSAADLVLDATRMIHDEHDLGQAVASGNRAKLGPSQPARPLPLNWDEKERELLSRADGLRTVAQILEHSSFGKVEALQRLLTFKAVGMLAAVPLQATAAATGGSERMSELDRFLAKTGGAATDASSSSEDQRPVRPVRQCSPQEQEERESLLKKKREMAGQDHYTVLGVDRRASDKEIRKAYYDLARNYHPDRLRQPHLEDIHADLEKMFAAITEAYNILSEVSTREEYDRAQAERVGGRSKDLQDSSVIARDSYLRGRKMLEGKKIFEAISLFESAVKMDPSKSEYFYYLGISQAQNPRWKKKAEQNLTKAIEMNPGEAQGYLALARLYYRGGLERKAREMYREVLKWEPTNEEALAAMEGQQESAGGTGLLRSIFKKS